MGKKIKVIAFSGHMVDLPNRKSPRFPPHKEAEIKKEIDSTLDRYSIGKKAVGICGGACGADIIFAECCLSRMARVIVLIAMDEQSFIRKSVGVCGTAWVDRFKALLEARGCEARFETHKAHSNFKNEFEQTNEWLINEAMKLASPDKPCALVVWDEREHGDGKGGTSHFVKIVKSKGFELSIINPTRSL